MIRDVGSLFYRIGPWLVVPKANEVFDVIAFPYMTHYAIHSVFLRRIRDILLLLSRVPCAPFSISVNLVAFRPALLDWVAFPAGDTVAGSTDKLSRMPSS